MDQRAVEFVKEQIYGWVGNLMRDMDAQGTPVEPEDIAEALEQVAYMVDAKPGQPDFDEFLRDLTDGLGEN